MKEFIVFMAILKGGLQGHADINYEVKFKDMETCKVFQKMVHTKYNETYLGVHTDCFKIKEVSSSTINK